MGVQTAGTCRVCAQPVASDQCTVCPRCGAPHHQDCWAYNGGCTVYGCDPSVWERSASARGQPRRSGRWFKLGALAGLVAALAGGFLWYGRSARRPRAAAPPPVLGQAPTFCLARLSGSDTSFDSFRGDRVAIVTPFVERCPDCMPGVPALAALSARFADDDRVRFCSVTFQGTHRTTEEFVARHRIRGTVFLDGDGEVMYRYRVRTLTTFVVDRQGRIRYSGPPDPDTVDEVVEALLVER
ncbi:MAG: redoxin domain-containing protein [Candidatus Riflebacteria bacterium]|nr:redoxin domain-containing protein [Candidatus Riflebacteria bacterium]